MKTDRFTKLLLIAVFLLLFINFLTNHISLSPNKAFSQGFGSSIACSSDGKYVYIFTGNELYKSDNACLTIYHSKTF